MKWVFWGFLAHASFAICANDVIDYDGVDVECNAMFCLDVVIVVLLFN